MLSRLVVMTPPKTAIVIGGGPAGLTAAAHLAQAGVKTTLLEASHTLGGRASTQRKDGFDLNEGGHALYVGGPGMRELKALGVRPDGWNPVAVTRSVFTRGGKVVRNPGGNAALARWVTSIARGKAGDDLHELTVSQWLDRSISSKARESAEALVRVTTFVADHEQFSADVAAFQIKIGLWPGVRYLRGGWQVMIDDLADVARRRGVEIRTRAGVRAVGDHEVTLDDETLRADVIIVANGGPKQVAKLLGDRTPSAPGPAAEVSALDVGLKRLPKPMRRFALGLDEATYISRHSPKGHPAGTLMSLVGYARQPLADLERFAEVVQPGWRDELLMHRHLPKMDAVSAITTPATGGLRGRPDGVLGDGLFVAGDWIGPEGWLTDAALVSGAQAAAKAVGARQMVAA
jgi:phytoene dehydrogenase-like protein